MTELAAGAGSSLLVVIRNESLLLSGVQDDVQFIKEEMESMNSFLAHLARSTPPGGEHDEQVRTWMNQVRLLAQDCNNCIDLYLYSGNPDIHRAKGRLRRYLWWAYWFLRKMVAQHNAAVQLCQLKDRARDVGERRLRYGVEIPEKTAAGRLRPAAGTTPLSSAMDAAPAVGGAYVAAYDEEGHDDHEEDHHSSQRTVFEPRTLDDYVKVKLLKLINENAPDAVETLSIAIVAPDADNNKVLTLALQTLVMSSPTFCSERGGYRRGIVVDIPAVHLDFLPLRPKEVLYYILRELKKDTYQVEEVDLDPWEDYCKKLGIYHEKKRVFHKIKSNIERMKIYEKLDKIESDIQVQQQKGDQKQLIHLDLGQKKDMDQMDLVVLLQMLLLLSQQDQENNTGIHKLLVTEIAKKLKEHLVAEDKEEIANHKLEEQRKEEKQDHKMEEKGDIGGHERNEEEEKENQNGGDERNKEKEENQKGDDRKYREENKEKDEKDDSHNNKAKDDDDKEKEDDSKHEDDDDKEDDDEPIFLHEDQNKQILQEVFLKTTSNKPLQGQQRDRSVPKQTTKASTTPILDKERIKQIIQEAKQEVLRELQEEKSNKNQAEGETSVLGQNQKVGFVELKENTEEIKQKFEELKHKFKEQLKIKGIVDKIKHLWKQDCPLIIVKGGEMIGGSRWEEIRKALSLLECSADAMIFTTESIRQAKEYCYPPGEPLTIDYSSVGLYHDTVLELTKQHKNEENYDPQVFRSILEECFFSMKT